MWEHTIYVSDGTQLTESQYKELCDNGRVEINGRMFEMDVERARRDIIYATRILSEFKENEAAVIDRTDRDEPTF